MSDDSNWIVSGETGFNFSKASVVGPVPPRAEKPKNGIYQVKLAERIRLFPGDKVTYAISPWQIVKIEDNLIEFFGTDVSVLWGNDNLYVTELGEQYFTKED